MREIAISTTSFGEYDNSYVKLIKDKGFEISMNPHGRKIKKDELLKLAKGAVGLIAGTEAISDDVLKNLNLKVISRCGSGIENIDIAAAKKRGIKVFRTPNAPVVAVAELTLGMMLSILRKISLMDKEIRDGQWNKKMGSLLSGKKVGIMGFGRIGKTVAKLLKPFGCEVAYCDPFVKITSYKKLSKGKLLKWADIVTIHVPNSKLLIGKKELKMMKDGAFLINTSRGGVIDEASLYRFLKNRYLAGAALDVFSQEPYSGQLRKLDNVMLTPHIGSYAKEARINMEREAVSNLLKGLKRI